MRLAALALGTLLAAALPAPAARAEGDAGIDSALRTAIDGTLYGSASRTVLRRDSVLNPGNQIARLAQASEVAELRLNIKAENESVRLTARAIATQRETRNGFATQQQGSAYLSQWQIRVRASEGWNVAAGRDLLNWGPAQFRSPSSPFYFDNGRSDPLRELSGIDSLKLTWTPDMRNSVSLVRTIRAGERDAQPEAWRNGWLAKYDRRGEDWTLGVLAAKMPALAAFYGAHGQAALNDALMLYAEASSSVQPQALQPPADATQPLTIPDASPRHVTALAGASYTFANGGSLAAEYLHDAHGYTPPQERAYFQRAAAQANTTQEARSGPSPRLLGRDYLHFVWQSNLMDEHGHWRLMATRNLTDGGNELAAYGETALSGRLSAYALAVLPQGNARQELSSLLERSITLGLKIALP